MNIYITEQTTIRQLSAAIIPTSNIAKQWGFRRFHMMKELFVRQFYGTTWSKAMLPDITPDSICKMHYRSGNQCNRKRKTNFVLL